MTIELASDLDGYEAVEWFYPFYTQASEDEMNEFIRARDMRDDPLDVFYKVSVDRYFIMAFHDGGHDRDSSNDCYVVYQEIR